jgi:hypothetical protein
MDALDEFRAEKDSFFKDSPDSPLTAGLRRPQVLS